MDLYGLVAVRPYADVSRDFAPLRNLPADGLAGSPLAGRFCFWRGRSGRRYVFSVYRTSTLAEKAVLPRYADAVVIAAERRPDGSRRLIRVGRTGSIPELELDAEDGLASLGPTREVHYHLLAGSAVERRSMVQDLGGSEP